jgi:hypothetical protein
MCGANAEPLGRIRRDNARPARVRDHEEPVSRGRLPLGESQSGVEKVLHALGPHHTGLLEGRFKGRVRPRERAGMRRCRAGAGLGAAGLEQDDGLDLRGFPGDLHEPPAVHHVLEVAEDKVRFGVIHEVFDDVDLR